MEKLKEFYNGKKVLVTGHTGFKGSWLSIWLKELGAEVFGYSLDPLNHNDIFTLSNIGNLIKDFRGDIRDKENFRKVFEQVQPDVVFHLAAQPLVIKSYQEPLHTYEVNLMGTLNVLEEIKRCKKKTVGLIITTDKVYLNTEKHDGYEESDPLGGYDPYSSSKAACELAVESWQSSFFSDSAKLGGHKAVATARAGNVIGGGDWSEKRLVPDVIRSIEKLETLELRDSGAIRPWQHVLDPIYGYLLLAKNLFDSPKDFYGSWNFGPSSEVNKTVGQLVKDIFAQFEVSFNYNSQKSIYHETKRLSLNSNKALLKLGWKNYLDYENSLKLTTEWYKNYNTKSVMNITLEQIMYFSKLIEGETN